MAQRLTHADLPDPDVNGHDRATSSGPDARARVAERDQMVAKPPVGMDALARLARLLGRQAAQEWCLPQG